MIVDPFEIGEVDLQGVGVVGCGCSQWVWLTSDDSWL